MPLLNPPFNTRSALIVSAHEAFALADDYQVAWSATVAANGTADTGLSRANAGVVQLNNAVGGPGGLAAVANTPTALSADANDYAAGSGWFQRWSATTTVNITGLAAGADGETRLVVNIGSTTITLKHQSSSSSAANRFLADTGADVALTAGTRVLLVYDLTTQRWRASLVGGSGSSTPDPAATVHAAGVNADSGNLALSATSGLVIFASALHVTSQGALQTEGVGPGGVAGNNRGVGAVDLQVYRTNAAHVASGDASVISGGQDNTASATWSTVGGGQGNNVSAARSVIGGGWNNTANQVYATVGGGWGNQAAGTVATVAGGGNNYAAGTNATAGGGYNNQVTGTAATVGGGVSNQATASYTAIAGGRTNHATATGAMVGGGHNNTASAAYATAAGGLSNAAGAAYATVGGGRQNAAYGTYATIPGGWQASADLYGQLAVGAGQRATLGDNQTSLLQWRGTTTNGTATEIFLGGQTNVRAVLRNGNTWGLWLQLVARDTSGNSLFALRQAVCKRVAGTTSLVGTVITLGTDQADTAALTWTFALTADDTNHSLKLAVTGAASTTIYWKASAWVSEVG